MREAARRAGVGAEILEQRVQALSGGQRQRVALARALATRPRVLLADEPTSGLDLTLRQQVLHTLKELTSSGDMSLLMVTHDLEAVVAMCAGLIVMEHGRVREISPTARAVSSSSPGLLRSMLEARPRLEI